MDCAAEAAESSTVTAAALSAAFASDGSNGPIYKYIHKNMHINEPQTTILNSEHLNQQAKKLIKFLFYWY